MKKLFCVLTLALFSLALLTGCGSSGDKLSDADAIEAYGTMIWGDKLIDVCFTHDQEKIYIYYDDGDYALFETADLPVEEFRDDDNEWRISSVETEDITDNGYSDLRVYISHSDMSESTILWTWNDAASCYVYHATSSFFYQSNVVDDQPENDFSMYEGIWRSDVDNQYSDAYIMFDAEGYWQFYIADEMVDEGYLLYEPVWDYVYVDGIQDSTIEGGQVELVEDRLYITTIGYFNRDVLEDYPYKSDNPYYNGDSGVYHRDISEFQGTWYYDKDLSATMYIVIDGYGNWRYYERASGDAEGTEMDYGTFSYSADESDVYYADSDMYNDVRFRVYDLDEDILVWNEGTFYRIEDGGYSDNRNGNSYYSWNSELHQRNVSELKGTWYCDEDRSSMIYIVIDGYGNWKYYERASSDAEGAEMDYGTFSYSTYEDSTYYANSALYDGLSFRVLDFDNDILIWNDLMALYRMW